MRRRLVGQPQGERHEGHRQDDQEDHEQVEDPDGRLGGQQLVGRHELDRPERRRQRDAERRVEALGEDVGRRRGRVRSGSWTSAGMIPLAWSCVERGADDREDVEHDVAVDHDEARRTRRAAAGRAARA